MANFFSLFTSASTLSGEETALFLTLLGITVFFTLLIGGAIVFFVIRYRAGSGHHRPKIKLPVFWMEFIWTAVPLLIVTLIFLWAASLFQRLHHAPKNAMEIYVTGKQWMWKVQHSNGRREINEMHVPLGVPVKLVMISEDVIHSFFIPAFRVKQDVLPGRYTSLWFQPTKVGSFYLFCAQYCGTSHSQMTGKIIVMDPPEFETWLKGQLTLPVASHSGLVSLAGRSDLSMTNLGGELSQKYACVTCHKLDGSGLAPSLKGLYLKQIELSNGKIVVANEDYIRESILTPGAKIVKGYQDVMPTYKGILSEEQLSQVIAYVKSLSRS